MASAAITLAENPATIESDTSEAVITNPGFEGTLVNGDTTSTWIKTSVTDTAASGVATTGAQAQHIIELPGGASMDIPAHYKSIAHLSTGTTVLFWIPRIGRTI